MKTERFGENETLGNHCDNVNMWYLTTEVTVVHTSRPMCNSQLDVDVKRIKLPKYTTTRDQGGKHQPSCSSGMP